MPTDLEGGNASCRQRMLRLPNKGLERTGHLERLPSNVFLNALTSSNNIWTSHQALPAWPLLKNLDWIRPESPKS